MTDEMKKAVSSWETGKFIPDAEHLPQLLDWAAFSFDLFCCRGGNGSARPGSRGPNAPRDGITLVPEVPRRWTYEMPKGNIIALRETCEGRDSH